MPTYQFQEQTAAFYEEADLIEEWREEIDSEDVHASTEACVDWLRTDHGGTTY